MNKTLLFIIAFLLFAAVSNAQQLTEKLSIITKIPAQLKKNQSIQLKVLIKNTLHKEATGNIILELFDVKKRTSIDGWFYNIYPFQYFTGTPGEIFSTTFPITVPGNFTGSVRVAITAVCGNTKDSINQFIKVQ